MNSSFRLDSKADGTSRVIIDGEDLSSLVGGYILESRVAAGTVLALEGLNGDAIVTGTGRVLQLTDGIPAHELLDRLDSGMLEVDINKHMELNGSTVGQAILAVLGALVDELNEQE